MKLIYSTLSRPQASHNQNPVLKWSTQNHVKRKEGGRNYFGLGLPLTNLHLPGFDCGSSCNWRAAGTRNTLQRKNWGSLSTSVWKCPTFGQLLQRELKKQHEVWPWLRLARFAATPLTTIYIYIYIATVGGANLVKRPAKADCLRSPSSFMENKLRHPGLLPRVTRFCSNHAAVCQNSRTKKEYNPEHGSWRLVQWFPPESSRTCGLT